GNFDQLLAPLLVQFRDTQADGLTFRGRRQAEVGIDDRLLDRMNERAVPDIDRDQARLRYGDAGALLQGHLRAVGFDHDGVEQVGGGAPGAQSGQFRLQRGARALHAPLDLVDVVSWV